MRIGAFYQGHGKCVFRVFAPEAEKVRVEFTGRRREVRDMHRRDGGYWESEVDGIEPGDLYEYRIGEGASRPDPASHFQPQGVHGPSQVVDHAAFRWTDQAWQGVSMEDFILYEIHVGTFTGDGTLEAAIARLPHLKALGVTAIEIMPVNQFPGSRNWGYDGAYAFAVQNTYGGPEGLKRLVDAAHAVGLSVVLDVVYNHFGPEGTYLQDYGPYFTGRYRTPWGSAINFDGPWSDQVRDFFIENALHWFRDYHVDALRLDAVHQMYDMSAQHFLAELGQRVDEFSRRHGRTRYLIAESDLNDPRVLNGRDAGGYGMHAQWLDDFQHCVDSLLRGDASPYRRDYGAPDQFAQACREGFVYAGEFCPSRGRRFGASSALRPPGEFIAFVQNHDQVGNRPAGERFNVLVDFESSKLAAGILFLSPYVPLLFMGEEYGETNPFQFFADFSEAELLEAVRRGRKEEFGSLGGAGEHADPFDPETFLRCKLDWNRKEAGRHKLLLEFYTEMIALRKAIPSLRRLDRAGMEMNHQGPAFFLLRRSVGTGDLDTGETFSMMNFKPEPETMRVQVREGEWTLALDSSEARWGGPGGKAPSTARSGDALEVPARGFLLYRRTG